MSDWNRTIQQMNQDARERSSTTPVPPASATSFRDGVVAAADFIDDRAKYHSEPTESLLRTFADDIRALTPPAASQDSGAKRQPFKMRVDNQWLKDRIAEDPDNLECEAHSPETTDVRERAANIISQWLYEEMDFSKQRFCKQIADTLADANLLRTPDIADMKKDNAE